MLTRWLERVRSSRTAQVVLGASLVCAGVLLGTSNNQATEIATNQASTVAEVCSEGGPAAQKLDERGACQQAAQVIEGSVRSATGQRGALGAPVGAGAARADTHGPAAGGGGPSGD